MLKAKMLNIIEAARVIQIFFSFLRLCFFITVFRALYQIVNVICQHIAVIETCKVVEIIIGFNAFIYIIK